MLAMATSAGVNSPPIFAIASSVFACVLVAVQLLSRSPRVPGLDLALVPLLLGAVRCAGAGRGLVLGCSVQVVCKVAI